jgi:D-3-phosphoglycerate dehydrogenase / 2-oxoglutarate reductase
MTEVLALEGVKGPALEALATELGLTWADGVEALPDPSSVRALIVRNQTIVDAELLERLPALEVVARAGVGLDNIDVDACSAAGVVVTYAPGENADSTAEHTLALALAAAHRVAELDRAVRQGEWNRRGGRELRGGAWGVVGFGRIGRRVAALARGIGMTVLAADPAVDAEEAARADATLVSLERLLERALVISLHVPLVDGVRNLIGAAELARMRPDAILVNTARGGIVDETALAAALAAGRPAAAALDVRDQEPPAHPDPLADLDQVVLTPHVAALTSEAQARVLQRIADDVRAVLAGGEPERPVNFGRPRPATPPLESRRG